MPGLLILSIPVGTVGGLIVWGMGASVWTALLVYAATGAGLLLGLFGVALICVLRHPPETSQPSVFALGSAEDG